MNRNHILRKFKWYYMCFNLIFFNHLHLLPWKQTLSTPLLGDPQRWRPQLESAWTPACCVPVGWLCEPESKQTITEFVKIIQQAAHYTHLQDSMHFKIHYSIIYKHKICKCNKSVHKKSQNWYYKELNQASTLMITSSVWSIKGCSSSMSPFLRFPSRKENTGFNKHACKYIWNVLSIN